MLRVIAGEAKGLKLKTVDGINTRPTADRVKESLFNIIAADIKEADILDLFAGTGNLGIEALSRGANFACFVDQNKDAIKIIKENLIHTKLTQKAQIINMDFMTALRKVSLEKRQFDLVFMDPPYHKGFDKDALNYLGSSDIIREGSLVIIERSKSDDVPEASGCLILKREQKYGDTIISIYNKKQKE